MKFIVAAIQLSSVIGEIENNIEKGKGYVEEAVSKGAKLICLPEMFNTGYFSHTTHCDTSYLQLAETLDGKTIATFREMASKHNVYINVPFFEHVRPGVNFNSSCLIDDTGDIVGCYRKTHLPWSLTGWEKFYMRPGYEYPVFRTRYGAIGMMICYDRDFPEAARSLGLNGADIILVPNGASAQITDIWTKIIQVRAYENQVYILGACLTGKVDEEHHEFCGHSMLTNPFGEIEEMLGNEEGILLAEVDLEKINSARNKRFLYRDRRPEIYGDLVRYQ